MEVLENAKIKFTAADLRERLKAYHEGGEWVIQFEVANGTGASVKRHADAVAMSIWPSRGYKIHGYEIKVSRGDWQREMRMPEKADAVGQFCDAWFLVAPLDIVSDVEIPDTWGWMIPSGKSLRIKKQPKPTPARDVNRAFIAAMLRNNHSEDEKRIAAKVRQLREQDQKLFEERLQQGLRDRAHRYESLKKIVEKFEAESGLSITSSWGGDNNIGRKVKLLEAIGDNEWSGIPQLIKTLKTTLKDLEDAHGKFLGGVA